MSSLCRNSEFFYLNLQKYLNLIHKVIKSCSDSSTHSSAQEKNENSLRRIRKSTRSAGKTFSPFPPIIIWEREKVVKLDEYFVLLRLLSK